MGQGLKIALALCAAAAGPAHAAAYVATSPGLDGVNHRILAAHNMARADVGAPPLQWDPALAVAAASYGPALSRAGRLVHSPRAGRENQRENLWMGQQGRFGPEQMVAAWTDEKRLFLPGQFPNVSRTGNWADVAHYTQMIWKGTTHVGCAIYRGGAWDYLICRYSPPGNRDGKAVP
ncbi:MAG TPA: CAP domain-containing protein [Sphingomicrobium sp.]|nr:CAP domain-containing protein [Sphingomicrobium sp.]